MLIDSPGWTSIQVAPVMRDLATGMLGIYFFGEKLCKTIRVDDGLQRLTNIGQEPVFALAMSRYYDDTVACMGAMQVLPTILQP